MDEAHNARTPLSFDTLARFNPSCIIEFTATPETTHKPIGNFLPVMSCIMYRQQSLRPKK